MVGFGVFDLKGLEDLVASVPCLGSSGADGAILVVVPPVSFSFLGGLFGCRGWRISNSTISPGGKGRSTSGPETEPGQGCRGTK